jgi:hypothetical protein
MDQKRYLSELAKISQSHEIEKYTELNFIDIFSPYNGYPRRHPFDKTKFTLYSDPFSGDAPFYEFPVSSIGRIDEIETVSAADGSSGILARVWIKRGTIGILARSLTVD